MNYQDFTQVTMSNNSNNSNFNANGVHINELQEVEAGNVAPGVRSGGRPPSRVPGQGTARNYCVTIHVTDERPWNINGRDYSQTKISFIIGQLEICPTTGSPHYQIYLQTKQPVRFTQVKTMLQCTWAHFKESEGSAEQNIIYCSKEDTRAPGAETFRWGICAMGQGARTDLAKVSDDIKAGKSLYDIAMDSSEHFLRHARNISLMSHLIQSRAASTTIRHSLEVILILGHPGTGKTRYVYEKHGLADVYKLNTGAGTTWWDGYSGQPVLLMDDFYGTGLQWKELLNILDIYPLQVQVKGSTTWVNYNKIYITSNTEWFRWYPSVLTNPQWKLQLGALYRRLSLIYRVPAPGTWVLEKVNKTPTGEPILPDYCEPSQWAEGFIPPPGPVLRPVDGILEPALRRQVQLLEDDEEPVERDVPEIYQFNNDWVPRDQQRNDI